MDIISAIENSVRKSINQRIEGVGMDKLLVVIITSFVGSAIQAATGFGAAIVIMLFMPTFFDVVDSTAIVGLTTITPTIYAWVKYRKYIDYRKIILPAVFTFVAMVISIGLLDYVDVTKLKIYFGAFLILLALYFLFVASKVKVKNTIFSKVACAILAGAGGGFFGISGPPGAVYFLSSTDSREEYLGVLNAYFTLVLFYSTVIRFANGIITVDMTPYMIVGAIMCLLGIMTGSKLLEGVSPEALRKFIYIFMIFAGAVTIIQSII